MGKRLIIVRHGNTFLPTQTPTRVGCGTDLPLVEEARGRAVGKYILSEGYHVDKVYAAPLKRTMKTAQLALDEMNSDLSIIPEIQFSEIDYGPDENKTEEEVAIRLGQNYVKQNNLLIDNDEQVISYGKEIIKQWDKDTTVPDGWSVDVEKIIATWHHFADEIGDGETVMICSSNGIIRFAPHILEMSYEQFCKEYDIKVATGSVSVFENKGGKWTCVEWNVKPYKIYG